MKPAVPRDLLDRASEWNDLHRWERSELGKALRRLGLTYAEIREVVPVPKSTLSGWCRDIRLTAEQVDAIRDRSGPGTRAGVPVDTQWKRRAETAEIRSEARRFAEQHIDDPFFVAGVTLYWGEGFKTRPELALANADPRALRLFISWVRAFLDRDAAFVLKINLHADNNESAARTHWQASLGLTEARFHKTFVKPDGTGHRKNHLPHGVCQVRVHRSADYWHQVMEWIDMIAASPWVYDKSIASLTDGSLAQ